MNFTPTELIYIQNAFNDGGYVLDFNDATFSRFTIKTVGIDIQKKYKLSKGKSMMSFFEDADVRIEDKIHLLIALLESYEAYNVKHMYDYKVNPNIAAEKIKKSSLEQCEQIIQKYSGILSVDSSEIIEEGLSELIEKANYYYPKDIQIALEKAWDAFERIKTMFKGGKKTSIETLIQKISNDETKHIKLLNDEFFELTSIGNNFRIRHFETDKIEIVSDDFKRYLFNRCMSLIKLSLNYIDNGTNIKSK